jgi:hypothetical protein
MSTVYDPRPYDQDPSTFHAQLQEAQEHEQHDHLEHHEQPRYPSPPPPLSETPYAQQQAQDVLAVARLELPELPTKEETDVNSPGRSKPIPKPDREVTKDQNGRFYCTWPNCTEEIKDFGRKCEWRLVITHAIHISQS